MSPPPQAENSRRAGTPLSGECAAGFLTKSYRAGASRIGGGHATIRKQRRAAEIAAEARKLVARWEWHVKHKRGIPNANWLSSAAMSQQRAAETYAEARAVFEMLLEAGRQSGVPSALDGPVRCSPKSRRREERANAVTA